MTAIIAQFLAPALPWLIAAITAIAGLWGYGAAQKRKGRKEAETIAAAKAAKANAATRERIDHAVESLDPVDADAARSRLRDRGNR